MTFEEFFERYSILNWDDVFTKNLKSNCELILKHIALDAESFKIGITKLFFKNGVLGSLEELRDSSIKRHLTSFQSLSRGQLARTKIKKQISLIQASQVIARNFQKLDGLVNNSESPWLKLFVRLKPLLEDSVKVLDSREMNESLKQINGKLKETEASKIVLENENTSLKERLQSLEDDIIKAAEAASQKMDKLKSLERDEQSRSAKLDDTLRQLSEVQAVSAALAKEKVELLGKLEESQKRIANFESQVELLENERNTQVEAVKTLEAKVKNFANIEADHQKALGVVKTLEQKCKSHSEISKSLDVFKSNIEEKDRNLASSKTQIEANESRIAELEALIKSSSSKNEELMKSTMESKSEFSATLKSLKEENMSLKADV
ncbi:hypothetical protein OXX80_012472, partial [Metschnikowia pulcherrima]